MESILRFIRALVARSVKWQRQRCEAFFCAFHEVKVTVKHSVALKLEQLRERKVKLSLAAVRGLMACEPKDATRLLQATQSGF